MRNTAEFLFSNWWNSFCQFWDRSEEIKFISSYLDYINCKGSSLLDVGCADLFLYSNFSLQLPNNYTGLEPNIFLFNLAQKHYPTIKLLNVGGQKFQATSIKYDYIFLFWVLHHSSGNNSLLSNCNKYLADNGKLIIAMPNLDSQLYYEIFKLAQEINPEIDFIEPNILIKDLKEIILKFFCHKKLDIHEFNGKVLLPENDFLRAQILADFFFWLLPVGVNVNTINYYQDLIINKDKFKKLPDKLIDKSLLIEISNN